MGQDFLKDITPPARKRSIRDIPIPVSRKGSDMGHDINLKKMKITESADERPIVENKPTSKSGIDEQYYKDFLAHQTPPQKKSKALPIFALLLLAVVVFGGLHIFASATITLHIKDAQVDVNNSIDIIELSQVVSEDQLAYREIPFSKEVSDMIEATGEEYVSKKSAGVITAFNEYSTKPQNLLKNTRFESSEGKIYRIDKSVNIPGYKTVNNKKVPGTIDVVVYADATGAEYDTTSTDFTVPGFKGQPQFTAVYGKLKNPIDGGFEGTRKIIDPQTLSSTTDSLVTKLKNDLVIEVTKQLPNNLIPIYDDSSFIIDPVVKNEEGEKVRISIAGKLTVKVVDKHKLSEKIAQATIPEYNTGENVLVEDFTKLSISLNEGAVLVTGQANIIWQIDDTEVKKMSQGTLKNQVRSTFQNLRGVEKIETSFMPVWKSAFPENIDRIKVEKVISNN